MIAALIALALAGPARAAVQISSATVTDPHQLVTGALQPSADFKPLRAFPEKLVFDVAWGILHVGQATLEAEDIVDFNGHPAYHVASRAVSNHFCDGFYKVRDLNESWIDARTLSSRGYAKSLREGHFFREEWVLFDEGRWVGKWAGRDLNYSVATGTTTTDVQDILSSLYFIRGQDLSVGKDFVLQVNTRQNWDLVVRVLKKERVRTPAGDFDAFLVEPTLRHEGLFIQKGNRLRVWLSDDARRVPVMMKVEVFFGSITARLSKMVF